MPKKVKDYSSITSCWEGVRNGNEHAFSDLFMWYYSDIYHYGMSIVNHPDLVKDTIQDVFSRLWEKRASIGEARNPKAYLLTSFRRRLFLNKEIYSLEVTDDVIRNAAHKSFSFEPLDFIETDELSDQLRHSLLHALNSLSAKQKEIIVLRFYHQLRYGEIAQIMSVNEQTVRNLMHRIMEKLRDKIDPGLKEEIGKIKDLILHPLLPGKGNEIT